MSVGFVISQIFAVKRQSRAANTWRVESLSILFSAVSVLVVLVLLAVYDDKLLFEWHRVTLNAIISGFGIIS
jgi:hypothetical protein